jgi:ketopantoate hydroxymethyltransferase
MANKVTIPRLQQMKRDGEKIVGVVVWDYQMALIADKAGVEIMSVGDSVGINLWGQRRPSVAAPSAHCSAAIFPTGRCRRGSTPRFQRQSASSRRPAST